MFSFCQTLYAYFSNHWVEKASTSFIWSFLFFQIECGGPLSPFGCPQFNIYIFLLDILIFLLDIQYLDPQDTDEKYICHFSRILQLIGKNNKLFISYKYGLKQKGEILKYVIKLWENVHLCYPLKVWLIYVISVWKITQINGIDEPILKIWWHFKDFFLFNIWEYHISS